MKLQRLEVNSFGGINPKSPVVLDFTESNFFTATGDQGVGKTSLLNSMLVACGQLGHTGKEGKDFINLDSGEIDINFSFVGNDKVSYDVRCTKSQFKLTYDGTAVSKPISKMKELLGVVGISPMEIKDKPLMEIVKWLSSYSNMDVDKFQKKLKKIKDGIKEAGDGRALANRQYKAIKDYLENDPAYINWEESEKTNAVKPDIDKLTEELKVAREAADQYERGEQKLERYKVSMTSIDTEIERLKKLLEEKEAEKVKMQESIDLGQKFLLDNAASKATYDEVKVRYDNIAQNVVTWNHWQTIKEKKKQMDEFETASQQLDSDEKKLKEDRKALQAEVLPDVRGVELVTEDNYDNGELQLEGLYWNGKNVAQMSESEFWGVILSIWKKYKVKIVVIDNMQSLGSKAVSLLEGLAKSGTYILAAQMERGTEELEISYQ